MSPLDQYLALLAHLVFLAILLVSGLAIALGLANYARLLWDIDPALRPYFRVKER